MIYSLVLGLYWARDLSYSMQRILKTQFSLLPYIVKEFKTLFLHMDVYKTNLLDAVYILLLVVCKKICLTQNLIYKAILKTVAHKFSQAVSHLIIVIVSQISLNLEYTGGKGEGGMLGAKHISLYI